MLSVKESAWSENITPVQVKALSISTYKHGDSIMISSLEVIRRMFIG